MVDKLPQKWCGYGHIIPFYNVGKLSTFGTGNARPFKFSTHLDNGR